MTSFGDRLLATFDTHGRLCVGIDPHVWLLEQWGLTDDAAGVREFGLRVVDAAAGRTGIVKPQIAFFERHGAAGLAAAEEVLAAARAAGLLVIADVKRGDVGTSVEAYAQAWLTPGSPFEADAMTISAFQGLGSLQAPLEVAEIHGKGLFVLAATSNPEAEATQTAVIARGPRRGSTVAAGIVAEVSDWNHHRVSEGQRSSAIGSIGVVLGATIDFADFGIDLTAMSAIPATPVLAPGFGAQGARFDQVDARYGPSAPVTIVSASRSILSAGPAGLAEAIDNHTQEVGR